MTPLWWCVEPTDPTNVFLEVVRVEDERQHEGVLGELMAGNVPETADESVRDVMASSGIVNGEDASRAGDGNLAAQLGHLCRALSRPSP